MHRKVFQIFFQIKMTKKLDRKIKMTEKESIKNHFLFKSYKGFKTRDLSVMKQKVSRGSTDKTENDSGKRENTDKGSHPSGLNFQRGETGLVGARELWWSPAAIHGELG